MAKQIKIAPAPDLEIASQVGFRKNDFDVGIWERGYTIIIEKALKCPCKVAAGGDHLSSCRNCGGSGWFFINPVQTKGLLQSINKTTKFTQWSDTNIGTASLTVRDIDPVAYMDRVTVVDSETYSTEILYMKQFKEVFFCYTIYDMLDIVDVFLYTSSDTPLTLLKKTEDYTFSGNRFILNDKYSGIKNCTTTIRYKHFLQFHIIDIPREVRNSYTYDEQGEKKQITLPVSAILRRSHNVLNNQNYTGDLIFDNSYEKDCKKQ